MRHVILSCGHLLHDRVALDARMLGQQTERTSTGGAMLPQPVLVKLVQMNRSRHSDTSESWTREEDALLLSKRLGLIIEGRDADVKALDNGAMPISGIEDKTAVDRIKRLRRIFTQESVDLMRSAGLESSTDRNASSPAAAAAAAAARSAAATAAAAAKPHEDLAAAARSAAATRSAKAAAAARAAPFPWMLSSSTTDAPLSPRARARASAVRVSSHEARLCLVAFYHFDCWGRCASCGRCCGARVCVGGRRQCGASVAFCTACQVYATACQV